MKAFIALLGFIIINIIIWIISSEMNKKNKMTALLVVIASVAFLVVIANEVRDMISVLNYFSSCGRELDSCRGMG